MQGVKGGNKDAKRELYRLKHLILLNRPISTNFLEELTLNKTPFYLKIVLKK